MKKYHLPNFLLKNIRVIPHVNYPPRAIVPLRQGGASDSQPLVSQGTTVNRGQIIAKGGKKDSQNHHSSIGGVVNRIKYFHFPGEVTDIKSIEIKLGGNFSTFKYPTRSLQEKLSNRELIRILKEAGIYDCDVGIIDRYLTQKQKTQSIFQIVINAIEFSPFLLLEEKILQMHAQEISIALKYIYQLFIDESSDEDIRNEAIKVIVSSNYFSNRKKLSKLLKINYKIQTQSFSVNKITEQDVGRDKSSINKNIHSSNLLMHLLSKHLNNNKNSTGNEIDISDNTVILKPSSLLAIYEAIVLNKPYIDSYIQITNGIDDIYVQKVQLGTPVLYLMSTFNRHWKEYPSHCFVGEFVDRKMLLNFTAPIMKNNLHYWLLTDEDFTIFYKRLQTWLVDV